LFNKKDEISIDFSVFKSKVNHGGENMSHMTSMYYIHDANSIDMINIDGFWQNSTNEIYKELLFFPTEKEAEKFLNEKSIDKSFLQNRKPVINKIYVIDNVYQLNYYALNELNGEIVMDLNMGHYLVSGSSKRAKPIAESTFHTGVIILPGGEKKEETVYVRKNI
jgi:hypothetical protein